MGVGSIFGFSNGILINRFKAPVAMILPGGIGNTIDLLTVYKYYLERYNYNFKGVIVNKIWKQKYYSTKEYLEISFSKNNINCFGYFPMLSNLTQI
ncbi:hypothetical protein BBF96_06510 [Anoxybacter fermentans]|uniref:Uncharacterized protein n=2 Tax=Anoxybacter fermentans TaxID=1323375 RepID=A0A3S9SXI6_9FIRM|nr:hypothetical protein BBF96_06510 [Anoxybacter fermentans]